MGKIGKNPKIGELWRPVAPQPYVVQKKADQPRKLPGPWTTTWSKHYFSAVHPVTCSLLWVRCLFDFRFQIWGQMTPKVKFSEMSFRIHWRDTELRFVAKSCENWPLQSCRKVVWITTRKKLGLRGTRPSPHFAQNGPITPKNSLNVVTPWPVHVYRIWSGSAALWRTYCRQLIFRTPKVNTIITGFQLTMKVKKIENKPTFTRLNRIHECDKHPDRRTDGQTARRHRPRLYA